MPEKRPLHYWSLMELSEAIGRRAVSPVEATEALLERIARQDGRLHSYVVVLADRARAAARRAEEELARGFRRGPLHGVPIAVKDLCYTTYAPTAAGTTIHAGWMAPHDATVVTRLEQAGAIMLGKLKMTEGAFSTHHPAVEAPVNPWDAERWVGSSSSGSGAATAAGLCYGSLGSDTGGSIRFPSACCGLTGLKPTWGRVSRHGVFALADSLDHIGPMTRDAVDAAAMLGVIAGHDPADATSLRAPVPDYLAEAAGNIRGVRVGIDAFYACRDVDPVIAATYVETERTLAALGAELREVRVPAVDEVVQHWASFCAVETALAHEATYPARAAEYGPELAGLIEHGRTLPTRDYAAILIERAIFSGRLAGVFEDVDLLLVPALTGPVPTLADWAALRGGADIAPLLRFTAPFDVSGSPTITFPAGRDGSGMPVSMQLVGRHVSEALLCRAAAAFQRATDWHTRHPADA